VDDGDVDHDYGRPGINHFGFEVEDLDVARERLERLGAHGHFAPEYEPGRRIYFLDPTGHEVELVQY
jgi:catechol 2,3-dioxygenase-like lactoylglutathione lyase family enzyme